LRKQNDVVISKSSELRLPQLFLSFAMTIKNTFSVILSFNKNSESDKFKVRASELKWDDIYRQERFFTAILFNDICANSNLYVRADRL